MMAIRIVMKPFETGYLWNRIRCPGSVLKDIQFNAFLYYDVFGFGKTAWLQRKEVDDFYLTLHSTHFIYGYMVSDIW